jgi:hypothetical protein
MLRLCRKENAQKKHMQEDVTAIQERDSPANSNWLPPESI